MTATPRRGEQRRADPTRIPVRLADGDVEGAVTGGDIPEQRIHLVRHPATEGWLPHAREPRGKPDRGHGLEAQAEDGNPSPLAASVKKMKGVVASGVFNTPVGDDKAGPALPGKAYEFTFQAKPGERLTVTTMFGQSNDLFYAPSDDGIALFENGAPISGDVTSRFHLWDAGTEVNEEPGFGPNQAPRQSAPNTGPSEHKPVRRIEDVKDGFSYPSVEQVLRVTIAPRPSEMVTTDAASLR